MRTVVFDKRERRSRAMQRLRSGSRVGVIASVVGVVAISAACSSSPNTSSPASDKVNLNAQPGLEVPDARTAGMIVPPAPAVPPLPAPGNDSSQDGAPAPDAAPGGGGGAAPSPATPGAAPDLYPKPEQAGEQRGTGQPNTKNGVTNAFVTKLTGADSADHTDSKWGVAGAGNAVMWDNGNGQVVTMFGDSFGAPRLKGESSDQPPMVSGEGINIPLMPKEIPFPALPFVNLKQGGKQGSGFAGDTGTQAPTGFDWRVNTLAYSNTRDLRQMSYSSFVTDRAKHAKEMVPARRVNGSEITTLPTSGISIGGRQYLAYSSVRQYGPAPGSWTSNYSGIAYSDDNGKTWKKSMNAFWSNAGAGRDFQMLSMARKGNTVYLFGTENGRVGGVYVAKVPANQLLNKSAYRYWMGNGWSSSLNREPRPIVSGGVGEVSVQWSSSLQRWLMISTDVFNNGIVVRQAKSPVGPWTQPRVIASAKDYPSIYGANIHPWSNGNDLFFTMSQWSSYNVYLMHATVTKEVIPGPPINVPEIPLPGGQRIPGGPAPSLPFPTLELPDSLKPPQNNPGAPRRPGQ